MTVNACLDTFFQRAGGVYFARTHTLLTHSQKSHTKTHTQRHTHTAHLSHTRVRAFTHTHTQTEPVAAMRLTRARKHTHLHAHSTRGNHVFFTAGPGVFRDRFVLCHCFERQ